MRARDDANGSLDPGEAWTFTCAHTFNSTGTFTDLSWASAYALTDGAPIRSTNAVRQCASRRRHGAGRLGHGRERRRDVRRRRGAHRGVQHGRSSPSSGIATYATPTTTGGPTISRSTCAGAIDVAGNAGNTATAHYTVRVSTFTFAGFFPPVDNRPTVNSVKAGSAMPVKFSLGGDRGLSIFAVGYPKSQQTTCLAGASVDGIEQTVNAGGSSLSYDAGTQDVQLRLEDRCRVEEHVPPARVHVHRWHHRTRRLCVYQVRLIEPDEPHGSDQG